ncbi:hypothetical protein EPO15_05680 [bacterium]|nr:MAG: hypothetical protein EPO15_05680 [bacterium]
MPSGKARPAALRVPLPAGAPRLAVLQTAYQLMRSAHVVVGGTGGEPFLELHPRPGVDAAAAAREAEAVFAAQLAREAVRAAGASVRAELTRRMLGLAGRAAARPQASAGLPPDAAARVQALLAEKGQWEADPSAIKTVWSDLKRGGAPRR